MSVKVASHEYKRDHFVVYINDEPWREIHRSIFGKSPSLGSLEKDLQSVEEAFFEMEAKLSKAYALRRLARKNTSSFEMRQLLRDRLVSQETTDKVISELKNIGYINDEDWIAGFIHRHMEKKQGPKSISMKLKAKGVPEDVISKQLKKLDSDFLQIERIKTLLETKYRNRDLSDYKEKQKIISALLRRGYDYDEINACLSTIEMGKGGA